MSALEAQLDSLEEFADEEMQEIPKVKSISSMALFLSALLVISPCPAQLSA